MNSGETTLAAATQALEHVTRWTVITLDGASLIVIALGAIATFACLPSALRGGTRFTAIRLTLARYLALALELQLASDVLSTAIAPTWDQLGTLGAIAAIRTMLNYFLAREMREERSAVAADGAARVSAATGADPRTVAGMTGSAPSSTDRAAAG